jgi:hypothetical protein
MLKSDIKPVRTWQYFHVLGMTIEGFGLIMGFPESLQKLKTNKDYALTVLYTLQISIAHACSACCVFSSIRVTVSSGGHSPSSGSRNVLLPQAQQFLTD